MRVYACVLACLLVGVRMRACVCCACKQTSEREGLRVHNHSLAATALHKVKKAVTLKHILVSWDERSDLNVG